MFHNPLGQDYLCRVEIRYHTLYPVYGKRPIDSELRKGHLFISQALYLVDQRD